MTDNQTINSNKLSETGVRNIERPNRRRVGVEQSTSHVAAQFERRRIAHLSEVGSNAQQYCQ